MNEKTTRTFILPSGAEVEVEVLPDRRAGAADVGLAIPGKAELKRVLAPLGEVAELLFTEIKSRVRKPDSLTLEFGASLKGQTGIVIVSGEVEATIKVSLTWKNTPGSSDED